MSDTPAITRRDRDRFYEPPHLDDGGAPEIYCARLR